MKYFFVSVLTCIQFSVSCEEMNKCGEVDLPGKQLGKHAHTRTQRPTVSHRVQFSLRWTDEETQKKETHLTAVFWWEASRAKSGG